MTVYKWSTAAATNSGADGSISLPEGMAPSGLNDAGRAIMAATKKWYLDISGGLQTAGGSAAYTLATNQVFNTLSAMSGANVVFQLHTTCASNATLNVDGLGAKTL